MLQTKPCTVIEAGGGWNADDQAVRAGAAVTRICKERCRDLALTPTGVAQRARRSCCHNIVTPGR